MADLQLSPAPGRTGQLYFMNGDKRQVVARNLDLSNPEAVQPVIDNALRQYPTQALKIEVFRLNGSSRKPESTISLSPAPTVPEPSSPPVYPNPTRPAAAPIPGLDNFSAYLLAEKDLRISEKDDTIRELRDANRISEQTIRELNNKVNDMTLDLKFKDREHEMELAGVESQKKGGLGGLMEVVGGLPPEVLGPLMSRFLGGGPAAAPAFQLGGSLSAGHQQAVSGTSAILQQVDELTAQKLAALVQRLATDPESLERVLVIFSTPNP